MRSNHDQADVTGTEAERIGVGQQRLEWDGRRRRYQVVGVADNAEHGRFDRAEVNLATGQWHDAFDEAVLAYEPVHHLPETRTGERDVVVRPAHDAWWSATYSLLSRFSRRLAYPLRSPVTFMVRIESSIVLAGTLPVSSMRSSDLTRPSRIIATALPM